MIRPIEKPQHAQSQPAAKPLQMQRRQMPPAGAKSRKHKQPASNWRPRMLPGELKNNPEHKPKKRGRMRRRHCSLLPATNRHWKKPMRWQLEPPNADGGLSGLEAMGSVR